MYLPVKFKFAVSLFVALLWAVFSTYIALGWIDQLADLSSPFWAWFIVGGIAIVPGFMNAFLVTSLIFDTRPPRRKDIKVWPDVSILIAAYNEEDNILSTLESIDRQNYPGHIDVIVIDDGSTDSTADKVQAVVNQYPWLTFLQMSQNSGKSAALNYGLSHVNSNLTITIDGDSYLYKNALVNLVGRYLSDPDSTVAVAGCVLVRNSRKNLVTKVQEWDYFHGIAAIKRLQSLFQGTLVAQGAFSIYNTAVLKDIGGWKHVVGEDIVMTWDLLERDYRVGYAEDAILFTNSPDTWKQFFGQRRRWSRGLIEAFKSHWKLLFKNRMTTLFIWWNLMFPWMDIVYTFAFIPGMIAAIFFQWYLLAGPMTLILLPMALLVNWIMFLIQSRMFTSQGLKVRKNPIGFMLYAFFYSIILQPACVIGYIHEIFKGSKKNWGTK